MSAETPLSMMERVVHLLAEARAAGWQISAVMEGDFGERARFEITIWREPPAQPQKGERS